MRGWYTVFKGFSGLKKYLIIMALAIVAIQVGGCSNAPSVRTMEEVPRISPAGIKSMLDSGSNFIIIDTRFREEYEDAHITGSISIPLEDITRRVNELKGYDEIVTYCT